MLDGLRAHPFVNGVERKAQPKSEWIGEGNTPFVMNVIIPISKKGKNYRKTSINDIKTE